MNVSSSQTSFIVITFLLFSFYCSTILSLIPIQSNKYHPSSIPTASPPATTSKMTPKTNDEQNSNNKRPKMANEDDDNTEENIDNATTTTSNRHEVIGKKGHVSIRGANNLALPMAYLENHLKSLNDIYNNETNPRGYITMAVAENKLVYDVLEKQLTISKNSNIGFGNKEVYSYGPSTGLPILRQAVATILHQHFWKKKSKTPDNDCINPNHIVIGTGAINLLSNIFFALGNRNDAVLIPVPYYAAFDNDLRAYAGCITIPVICQDITKGPTLSDLQQAKQTAEANGYNVRFLLLTNPHNPLGVIYSGQVIKDAITWARNNSMETIVDEIYALLVFGHRHHQHHHDDMNNDDTTHFQSIIELYNNHLGYDVHLIWGLSKDFGASGFRIGVLYSQNELLIEAMGNLQSFTTVSHPMQYIMADMLSDHEFVQYFLQKSQQRLLESYTICTNVLQELKIPYVHAQAGMFVYLDLSTYCGITTIEEETSMTKILFQHGHIVLTPGTTQHDPQPGKFRICYAYVDPTTLKVGMKRFYKIVTIIYKQGGLAKEKEGNDDWIHDDTHWQDII